jgi:hypothetical protein
MKARTLSTIPAPIVRDIHRQPWMTPPEAPSNDRCQRCRQPASYLVLSDIQTWICASCAEPEKGSAA